MSTANFSNILVTGANGFVGKLLCETLVNQNSKVRGAVRSQIKSQLHMELVTIGNIDSKTDWSDALIDIDVVIHLAARVHVMIETSADPLIEFRKVNVEGTRQLAMQAANAGVKRLIYVSTIKVNGEKTINKPFDALDPIAPQDAYGTSKYEAELILQEVASNTGLEVVIIRPPLIYGPGVKGNFLQMVKVVKKGLPLPFASVINLRSLVYVGNLVDALILCISHPNAKGQTYLISDGKDISTPALLKEVAQTIGLKARLLPCPIFLLKWIGLLTGRKDQMSRLLDSLQIDNGKLMRDLGWAPKIQLHEGLKRTIKVLDN